MKTETLYCDNCGEPLKKGKEIAITELPFDIASANEGESAVICQKCLDKEGYGICYVCGKPACIGDSETGECQKERCRKVFHTACDEGYHTDPLNFFVLVI